LINLVKGGAPILMVCYVHPRNDDATATARSSPARVLLSASFSRSSKLSIVMIFLDCY